MSMSRKLKKKLMAAALSLSLMGAGTAYAEEGMPQGGSVVTATAPTGFNANPASGAAMTATANTLINWDSFNLGSGKSLTLNPNGFVFMHQVTGATQSEIMGLLNGGTSGHLIIANPNGIFVNGATINASHLTLTTMHNLDATGFGKLTSGGRGPEVDTNGAGVGIVNSMITVNKYFGVLAGNILIDDHVTVNTQNSTIDLTAVQKGQYALTMGKDAFYSNGVQYTTTSNGVKIGSNTVALNANGNSYNQIHVLGGQVAIGDNASLNTGSDPNTSNVLIEAVATKNDSESDPDKRYTGSENNVINMGLVSFTNGNFALVGGNLTGETESFKDHFTKVSGDTPTPPGPEPGPTPPTPPGPEPGPTPPTPEPGKLTPEQIAQAHEGANNLLDSTRNNDAAVKAFQDALSGGSQKGSETGDHVVVQTGAEQNTGLNIAKGLEGLTVQEAAARSRNLAKQYLKALQDGDKAAAEQYKQQLKDANALVKALKEQEKNAAAGEAAKALQGEQGNQGQQGEPYGHYQYKVEYKLGDNQDDGSYRVRVNVPQDQKQREQYEAILRGQGNGDAQTGTADSANLKQLVEDLRNYTEQQKTTPETTQENVYTQTSSSGVSNIKELLEDLHKFVEEQKAKNQRTNARSFDETVTTAGEQKEPEGMKWFDNIIGEKLLTQEQNARNKLRNAKTSEERAAAMKELDEIHAEETKLVNEAMKQQEQAEQAAEQQARLETQRRNDEQLKAIGGDALQSAIEHAARTRQAANGIAELLKSTKDLYEEADRACRQLSTQYWKEKEAGASPEKLEEINQKWQELNKIRNELKETVSQLWRNSNEAQQKADEAAALKERAQTLAEIGKIENQKTLDEKAQLEVSLAKALQEKAQADANLEAAKANADAADKALGDARKEKEAAQAAVDAWSDRYDREHGGAELQAKLDALDQRLESLQNQYADDSTTPEQADRINEEISRAYEEKESLEKAYLSEKEKAFENSAENRSLHEANERYDHALNDTGSVDKAEKAAKDADKMVTYFQRNIDEKQADIDNATKTFEDRLDPESAIRRAESDLALAKMREDAAAENLAKAKEENKNKAQRAYDQAKDNTRQAMIAAGKASMLSKYDADAELSKLKAQQAKEQAANEQAARQGEQAKEQAANRAETSASGGIIHGGPTVSEAR